MSLPSGYKRLEYIESSGTQYIDTNINGLIKFVADIQFIGTGSRALMGYSSEAGQYFGINANNFLELGSSVISTVLGTKRNTITFDVGTSTTALIVDGVTISRARTEAISDTFKIFGGLTEYPCFCKLYSCQIYDNGTLVRDFIPCQTSSGEVGLWDDVNSVFYGNAGTGTFAAGPAAEYVVLEYIESTGTQYIDTGFKPNQDTRLVADMEVLTGTTSFLFGARANSSANSSSASFSVPQISGASLRADYGATETAIAISPTQRLSIDMNRNTTTVNGATVTAAVQTFTGFYSLVLFSVNTAGTVNSTKTVAKLYRCQIYDNGTLVRDFIPVQRVDGTVGLLDQVNFVFYPDAAGGNYVAGPVVPDTPAVDPSWFNALGVTMQAVVLTWSAFEPGQRFRLYRNDALIYEGVCTYYTDSGLVSGLSYSYRVTGFNGSNESDGVTLDVQTKDSLQLITDRTAADVSAGRAKGRYNVLDLIRVGEAMAYLEERFAAVGISLSVSPKLDWKLSDIPNQVQMLHYLEDVGVLRYKLMECRKTVSPPDSLNALTWAQANDIETILLDVEKLIQTIILSFRHYSGRAISGVNALP